MEFKIDTNPAYMLIAPITNHLDANLTGALSQKCRELTESGSLNYIIDLHNCLDADKASFPELVQLHEQLYAAEQSLVFTNIQEDVIGALKEAETDMLINIAPTMAEAVDIISMEILERDLFGEEE